MAGNQDAIDFTDNDIAAISNFPLSPRLQTLLLTRNRITQIQPNLANSIPNLTTLVLTSNNIAELADLDPLRRFPKLTFLTLIENPVTRKEVHTQSWVPSLKRAQLTIATELSILADLANPHTTIPRLPESKRSGERESQRSVRNRIGTNSAGIKCHGHQITNLRRAIHDKRCGAF